MYDGTRRPWRFRCPACESVSIRRTSQRTMPDMTHAHQGRRIANSGHRREIVYHVPRWTCLVCKSKFDTPRDMLIATHTDT